jgi:serine protease Do
MAAARILIQHLSGSKVNKIEQFALDGLTEITIGRDPASTINLDAQRDDAVSRRHAIITILPGENLAFRVADLGSRNGTLLNGERIAAEVELLPGDIIELGRGGPKFSFDVQPRPANLVRRTRQIVTGESGVAPTRIIDTAEIEPDAIAAAQTAPPPKVSVGRETVERLLTQRSHQTNKTWMYVLAGVLVTVAGGGGALYHYNKVRTEQARAEAAAALAQQNAAQERKLAERKAEEEQKFAAERAEEEKKVALTEATLRHDMGVSPEEIVRKYGNATVVIDVQWRLYDKISGKPLYQMVRAFGNEKVRLPCFVRLKNGKVVRWLTTEDQNQSNDWIGAAGHGSGFVIDAQGFIMTNKHVAAGWLIPYGQIGPAGPAVIYDIGSKTVEFHNFSKDPEVASVGKELNEWKPGDPQSNNSGGAVFRVDAPIPVDNQFHDFEGRNDVLDVRFPGSLVSISAHLLRANPQADAAEIKIDTQQPLTTVELAQDDEVRVGESVTVLGYPSFSTRTIALIQSAEAGHVQNRAEEVPEPTVTAGLVSQKSQGVHNQGSGVTTVGMMGDAYQLTVPTSAGNSGGPVFNSQGKVIGLFTYGDPKRETTTYAVPIKFGRSLFQVQRAD